MRLGNIPILLRNPEKYLASCRRQFALVEQQAERTIRAIEEQMAADDVMPSTRTRCAAMIDAVRAQTADIRGVLQPLLGDPPGDPLPEEMPAPLLYIHYLYRDWGWPAEANDENERILAALKSVSNGAPLGHLLVLGAGACRLAYDLHERDTTVVDIDPFLFAVAERVIRGGSVTMHEANMEIDDLDHVVKEWTLRAPRGPIPDDQFHFMIADGRQPPFGDSEFETIVTPWFIDLVPMDLRTFIPELHRLLKPGGRWLNIGPLHYRPEVPITRRFARSEIFEIAHAAGFTIDKSQTDSMPYLVSKLNGRGKIESVLTFCATKH